MYRRRFPHYDLDYTLELYCNKKFEDTFLSLYNDKILKEKIQYESWINEKLKKQRLSSSTAIKTYLISMPFKTQITETLNYLWLEELKDGNLLMDLIEILENNKIKFVRSTNKLRLNRNAKLIDEKYFAMINEENILICINYLKQVRNIKITYIEPRHIAKGDIKSILSLVFLIKHFYETNPKEIFGKTNYPYVSQVLLKNQMTTNDLSSTRTVESIRPIETNLNVSTHALGTLNDESDVKVKENLDKVVNTNYNEKLNNESIRTALDTEQVFKDTNTVLSHHLNTALTGIYLLKLPICTNFIFCVLQFKMIT